MKKLYIMNKAYTIFNEWKANTSVFELRQTINILKTSLSVEHLQILSNELNALNNFCKGDGAGLKGGDLIDTYLSEYFTKEIPTYEEFHCGESDLKISNVAFSLKKIKGKSSIAIDWSKNKNISTKDHFNSHIMIINLRTSKWWVNSPNIKCNEKITFNDTIPSGIYLIDKKFCKRYVKLSSNNKTDTLIDSQYLYLMLKRSLSQKLFIEIPEPNEILTFSIRAGIK